MGLEQESGRAGLRPAICQFGKPPRFLQQLHYVDPGSHAQFLSARLQITCHAGLGDAPDDWPITETGKVCFIWHALKELREQPPACESSGWRQSNRAAEFRRAIGGEDDLMRPGCLGEIGIESNRRPTQRRHRRLRIQAASAWVSASLTIGKGGMITGPHLPEPPLWICSVILATAWGSFWYLAAMAL